jgi:aminopeptidase N
MRPLRALPAFGAIAQLTALAVSCVLTSTPCAADTYPRQAGVDVQHYTFRVTLADDSDEIVGETTVALQFAEGNVAGFELDLASASSGKGMTVASVTSAGAPARYEHRENRLRITLDPPPRSGERREFTVAYRGVPAGGLRIGPNRHGERTFFSENWPDKARQWLPTIDHPYDKATSEFLIVAPVRYQAVANGLLQEERDLADGRRLTHWKQSVPIATWLNAIGVARFSSHHAGTVRGVPLQTWVFPQDRDAGLATFEGVARRALEFYGEHIGPYAYEKLANVQAAGLRGGTEHASAIFYEERSASGREATTLVAHEVAHQWFGDSVTERDWDDVWLSEGFATYFTLLFTEHDHGRDAFVAGLKRSRDLVFAAEARETGLAVLHTNLADTRKVLNPLVYQKGGWMLHMLRGQLGTDTFWAGIREYYRRHRDGHASTDDFRRVMEETSGRDLSGFFRQWLARAGSPAVEGTWSHDPSAGQLVVELTQTQPGEPYCLPIEIGISNDGSSTARIEKAELTDRSHRFEFSAAKEPSTVTLDPNCWVLMKSSLKRRPAAP